jgi:hydrogenase maturation protein HypF
MAVKVTRVGDEHGSRVDTVALSGGCFQNAVLFELVVAGLEAQDLRVLTHRIVPANDGGLALGQAAVAAARLIGADEC